MFGIGSQRVVTGGALLVSVLVLVTCSVAMRRFEEPQIPGQVNGWIAHSPVRRFDRKTLFRYIDGGAELYLAYRFREVRVHTYRKHGEPEIVLDVYDMGMPEDAFGAFTAQRESGDIGIGEGSEYGGGLLRFFKGRFFVSLLASDVTAETRAAVFSLGKTVAGAIEPGEGEPAWLSVLPPQGLIQNSVRYFYHPTILNLHYYLTDENVLCLGGDSRAVLARYAIGEYSPYLLVVRYPSPARAEALSERFVRSYMPSALEGMVERAEGQWTGVARWSRFVAIVLEAPSEKDARSLLDAFQGQAEMEG